MCFASEKSGDGLVYDFRRIFVRCEIGLQFLDFDKTFLFITDDSPDAFGEAANEADLVPARYQTGPVKVHSGESCLVIDGRFLLVVLPYNASIEER